MSAIFEAKFCTQTLKRYLVDLLDGVPARVTTRSEFEAFEQGFPVSTYRSVIRVREEHLPALDPIAERLRGRVDIRGMRQVDRDGPNGWSALIIYWKGAR